MRYTLISGPARQSFASLASLEDAARIRWPGCAVVSYGGRGVVKVAGRVVAMYAADLCEGAPPVLRVVTHA